MNNFLLFLVFAMCNFCSACTVKNAKRVDAQNQAYTLQIQSLMASIGQHLAMHLTAQQRTRLEMYQEELSDAAFTSDVEKIKILLRIPGIEVNQKNFYGQRPLQRLLTDACTTIDPERKIQSIILLLDAGADPLATTAYGINFFNDVFHHLHPHIVHDIRVQDALKRSHERTVLAPDSPLSPENSSSLRIVVPGKEFYLQATELPTPTSPLFSASFDQEEAFGVTFDEEEDVVHWHNEQP